MPLDPQVAAFYAEKNKKKSEQRDEKQDAPVQSSERDAQAESMERIAQKTLNRDHLIVRKMRQEADATFNDKVEILPIHHWEDRQVPGPGGDIPVRIYCPGDQDSYPVMVYFHGGGFVMHNIASHDALCRKLAISCDCVVVSVEYRLAPEHPYPACIEDGETVLAWAFSNAQAFRGNPAALMVAGDSAGASISAALSLLLRDRKRVSENQRGEIGSCSAARPIVCDGNQISPQIQAGNSPEISLQLLFYGTFGAISNDDSASMAAFGTGEYVLPRTMVDFCSNQFVPKDADPNDPYLNPGKAADLTGLPATISVTAEYDPLRDDGNAFAEKLTKAGNDVTRIQAEGMMHGFFLYWHKFDRAQALLESIGKQVQAFYKL